MSEVQGVPITMYGMKFQVSQEEYDWLMKLHEEDRFEELMFQRYKFHVLHKGGKVTRVSPIEKSRARQIFRFAACFVKIGVGAV